MPKRKTVALPPASSLFSVDDLAAVDVVIADGELRRAGEHGIRALDHVALQRSGDVEDPRARAGYLENYRDNHERRVRVKDRYDPANLFGLNANVRPSV